MKGRASRSARSLESLAFPVSVDRERELALKLEAEEVLPRELAGEVAAAVVSLWRPAPRARKKSKGVPWATRSEEHAGCFAAVEQEQEDGAALDRIAAGSAVTGFVQGDPVDAKGLGAGDGLEDLVATLSAIDELPVLGTAVEFAGTVTTAGELKGRARGAMRRLSRENQELHDTVALGLLDRLDGTRGSLHVNQWLSIDLLYGRSELWREPSGTAEKQTPKSPRGGEEGTATDSDSDAKVITLAEYLDGLRDLDGLFRRDRGGGVGVGQEVREVWEKAGGIPQELVGVTLSEGHSKMLKEVVEKGCAVRQLSVAASDKGVHMTLARWIKRRAPQESLDDLLDSLVQVLVIPTGAVVIQGRRKVVVGQDPGEDPDQSKRGPVRVEAALGIAMTPLEAACLVAGSEDARSCLRQEWLGEFESLVSLSQQFVERSSGAIKKAEQDLGQADMQEEGAEPVESEALQLHSRIEAAHAELLKDRNAAKEELDGPLGMASDSLTIAAYFARSLASWTDIQLRNRALAALVDIHLDRGLERGEALELALSSSPEQVWTLAGEVEGGLLGRQRESCGSGTSGSTGYLTEALSKARLDLWMFLQYLLCARPMLCDEGHELFPMKGGRPLNPASAERILGWGATSESHPRVEQARNGRGPYRFVSVEADMTHPCDRFAGSPDTFLKELQRIGLRASIPWQVAEVATVRTLLAGGDLELTPSLACAFEESPSPLLREQAASWLSSHPERLEDFADGFALLRDAEGLREALTSPFSPIRWCALMRGVTQGAFTMVEGLEVSGMRREGCWTEFVTFAKGKKGECELGSAMFQLAARKTVVYAGHLRALGRSLFVHAWDSDPSGETAERIWLQILSTRPRAILGESAFLSASLELVSPRTFRRVCSFVLTADMVLIRKSTIYPSGRIAAWLQTPSPDEAQVIAMNQQLEGDELSPAQREECERVKGVHVDRLSLQSPQGVDESANIISKWHGRAEEALGGIALRILARIRTRVLKPWVMQLATYANTERIRAQWLQALSGSVRDSTRRWALAEALVLLEGDEEGLDEVREVGWRLALEGVDESTASRVSEWAGSCREYLSRTPAVAVDLAAQPILELRTIGLELLQEASLTPALACRLAEGGAPDVVAECTRYLGTLEPGSAEATEAVLLLCDSAVEEARGAGLEYLHTHEEKTISEKVLAALAGSAHDDVRLVVATYLLDPAWDGFDASGFDRLVLGRVRGGSKVKALIKKRVERTGVMASEVLLDLARGTNRSDADWAMGVLSRRAVSGEAIPEIVMCEESQG